MFNVIQQPPKEEKKGWSLKLSVFFWDQPFFIFYSLVSLITTAHSGIDDESVVDDGDDDGDDDDDDDDDDRLWGLRSSVLVTSLIENIDAPWLPAFMNFQL